MKKLIIASILLGLAAALSAAEAVPEYVTLVIRDGRVGDTSQKNLGVTLWFEKDSAGVFRLKDVY